MKTDKLFRGVPDAWWVRGAVVSVALVLFYMIFGSSFESVRSHGADAFSRSAIGHAAIVEILKERLEVPVLISRFRTVERARPGDLLLLLEPPVGSTYQLRKMVHRATAKGVRVLLVLPKWRGEQGKGRRGWVESVELLPRQRTRRLLSTAMQPRDAKEPVGWTLEGHESGEHAVPLDDGNGSLTMSAPQWLEHQGGGPEAQPVWRSGDRVFWLDVGANAELSVLSDPDVLNTAGLVRGDHAELFLGRIAGFGANAVIIDQTLHGYERPPSPWRALLDMPLLPLTLQALMFFCLALWATTARFGVPEEVPSRLLPGKLTLVENTARLLALGRYNRYALERYRDLTVRRTAEDLGIEGSPEILADRLPAAAARRGVESPLDRVSRALTEVDAPPMGERRAVALAKELHGFRKEMKRKETAKER